MRKLLFLSVLAALVAGAAVYAAFRRDLDVAEARLSGRSQTVETTFGRLEYATVGEGAPVLALHGAAGGFDQGLDMTGALADRGYRVIAPSRFGYLRSATPPDLSTEMQADAYAQLLDRLGVERVTVVAISAGAWSAVQFAVRHGERCRALVLLVPADYLPEGTEIHGGALTTAMIRSDFVTWGVVKAAPIAPDRMTAAVLGTDARLVRAADAAEKARVRALLEHLLPFAPRSTGMDFDVRTAAQRTPYPLERIGCPVLAISAEDDRFGTAARAREIAAEAPNGRVVVFPTGGHALVGRYGEALETIVGFVEPGRH